MLTMVQMNESILIDCYFITQEKRKREKGKPAMREIDCPRE